MRKRFFTNYAILIKSAVACLLVLLASGSLLAQYKGSPVKKDKLISVLRSKQLQTREIVAVIKSNGVDFQVTTAVESELVAAGARPEVIQAARGNYRAMSGTGNQNTVVKSKFTGEPMTKDTIISLLQNGVTDVQVRKNVEARGVNFKATPAIKNEIRKAGGSLALANLVAASYVDPNQNSSSNNIADSGSADVSDRYENLITQAVDQYDNQKNAAAAIATLQNAIKAAPNEPRAYQLLGFMTLYGQKNFAEAEKYMREAINRGGSAVFRVFHDDDGTFAQSCDGSLFITKDTVRYESDNNTHTFETTDANIVKVELIGKGGFFDKINKLLKTKNGSFRIKLKSGDRETVKFGFAPLTDSEAESRMIIRLIGKNS